jgi:8-oxo-dGTP pyrophosphatase MutT (NUDIX family)
MDKLISHLSQRLQGPLPGQKAQYKMAHAVRRRTTPPPDNARMAGVLALLYPKSDSWHMVFIERPKREDDRHGGQISFPGGRREKEDNNLMDTALREAEEEVGVKAEHIQLLGPLTELYIPVSNYLVNPYVGFLDYAPVFRPQPDEVHAILEVPFTDFLHPGNRQKTNIKISPKITLRQVPYFNVKGKVIWGATAMMMSELVELSLE